MAQMQRCVDLEEIDSDALFGIDAFKGQSLSQKIVFWGSVIAGVLLNVTLPLLFKTPTIVCVIIFMVLLFVGAGYGCNYTEGMTYGKYIFLAVFKPSKPLFFQSAEDIKVIRENARKLHADEDARLRRMQNSDPESQKKILLKLLIIGIVFAVLLISLVIFKNFKKNNSIHHTACLIKNERIV